MKTLLLTSPLIGGFCLLLLFVFCFLLVHIFLLAKIGWSYKKTNKQEKDAAPERKEEKTETKRAPEPVYYIVEKKRKKPRANYSEPKEFHFK